MDSNVYEVSLELIFSCVAMIIGVGSFLVARNKANTENGRERESAHHYPLVHQHAPRTGKGQVLLYQT